MKVLDLQCRQGHVFEGWFASEDDFQSQKQRDLVQCPLCEDKQIEKRLSAPRLNLRARSQLGDPASDAVAQRGGNSKSSDSLSEGVGSAGVPVAGARRLAGLSPELQAAWLQVARHIVQNSEDVGATFAQEARRIHHGEAPERAIRGTATPDEAAELLEEGVSVVPLLLPSAANETLQ